MESWELKNVLEELKNGKEITRQLQLYPNMSSSNCSKETPEMLVQKIVSSFEKTLSMLNFNSFTTDPAVLYPGAGVATGVLSESPSSFSGSPLSQESDQDHGSRKRKNIWKQQVRVNPGMALEGQLDDGYNWRKYGQKDINGAKYPRGYYRCTHQIIKGCLATKQVQRSNQDPTIFDITYRGRHTCTQNKDIIFSPSPPPENQEPPVATSVEPKQPQENNQKLSQEHELVFNFSSGLKVISEDSYSFNNFPSTSDVFKVDHDQKSQVFSPTVALDFPFDNVEFDPDFIFDNLGFLP